MSKSHTNSPSVISLKNVSKSFNLSKKTSLKESFSLKTPSSFTYQALKDVSIVIKKNQTVGLFGNNGSGKSTILRLIAGMLKPDRGKITTKGKIAPIIELGSGLHPELTGSENIYLYGATLGMNKDEIDQKYQKIVDYAEIPNFLEQPIKKYSSGMKARLAFAIAIYSNPDIILLDEVLSVGDLDFRLKCIKTLKHLKKSCTIVAVSHDLMLLLDLCDDIIVLTNGTVTSNINQSIKTTKYIVEDILRKGHVIQTPILSQSMHPTIKKSDTVSIQRIPFSKLKVGDIIAFNFPNLSNFIVHRLIGKVIMNDKTGFITKGDAGHQIDPWIITKTNYQGKVVSIKKSPN